MFARSLGVLAFQLLKPSASAPGGSWYRGAATHDKLFGAAAAWPFAASAQQPALPVIGVLSPASPELYAERVRAFRQGLGETGHVEGRNVTIEFRWAEGRYDRLPALAADLVRRQVAVIAAISGTPRPSPPRRRPRRSRSVFQVGADPVEVGLVPSLARPRGNLTGVTQMNVEVAPKRLELLLRAGARGDRLCAPGQPDQSPGRAAVARAASGYPHPRAHAPCRACQRRTGFRHGIRNPCPSARRWAGHWPRIHSSTAGSSNSQRWRSATGCPRSTSIASSLRPAAW